MKRFFLSLLLCFSIFSIKTDFSPEDLERLEALTMDILGSLSPEEQEAVLKDAMELDKKIREMPPEEQKAIQDELEMGLKEMMDTGAIESLKMELDASKAENISQAPKEVEIKIEEKEDLGLKNALKESAEIIGNAIIKSDAHPDSDFIINEWVSHRPVAEELRSNLLVMANDGKILSTLSSSEFSILKAQIESLYAEIKVHANKLLHDVVSKSELKNVLNIIEKKTAELKIGIQKLFEKFSKEDIEAAKKAVPALKSPAEIRTEVQKKEAEKAKGTTIQKSRTASYNLDSQKTGATYSPGSSKSPLKSSSASAASPSYTPPFGEKTESKSASRGSGPSGSVFPSAPNSQKSADKEQNDNKVKPTAVDKSSSKDKSQEPKSKGLDFTEVLENQKSLFKKQLSKISGKIKETNLNEELTKLIKDVETKPEEVDAVLVNVLSREIKALDGVYDEAIKNAMKFGSVLKNIPPQKAKDESAKTVKMIKDKKPVYAFKQTLDKLVDIESKNPSIKNLQKEASEIIRKHKQIKDELSTEG